MLKKKKRGVLSMLQILIIGLVVAIIFFSAQYGWTQTMKKSLYIEGCRASVIKHSEKIAVPVVPDIDLGKHIELDCPRHRITFFDDHVYFRVGFDEQPNYRVYTENGYDDKFKELTDDIVNQVVAEEARVCVYELGEYGIPIRHIKNCIFCTSFNFDEEIKQNQFTGFNQYLDETDMPIAKSKKDIETKQKYKQYLSRTLDNGENTLKMDPNIIFEKNKPYIIYYEIDGSNYYLHIEDGSLANDCEWYN